ncbi:hypothetical protein STRIP9103_00743 [Streptomyces ipomoeae 91-03]|uniref:Uncharacterized protein n=1 Tax=Streptomyces ipomoeae 91-03 TaxID=698759 RepID=L1KRV2_9ACTN|nr:hypothetical protein STRIP9103_00743 [Streptomyces ipomoeae 91-03]
MTDHAAPGTLAARLTGRPVTGERRLSGALAEVTLDDGRVVVVKLGDVPARPGPRRRACAG